MPRLNDINIAIRLTMTKESDSSVLDISSATTKQIIITKPSGEKLTKTATNVTDGTDGKMQYLTITDDLDEFGDYEVQGHIVIGSLDIHTTIGQFKVDGVL